MLSHGQPGAGLRHYSLLPAEPRADRCVSGRLAGVRSCGAGAAGAQFAARRPRSPPVQSGVAGYPMIRRIILMSATIYCEFVTQSNANDSKAGLELIGLTDTVALGTPDEILAQMEEGRAPL